MTKSERGAAAALAILGAAIGIPALIAAMSVWRGYVLSILWGWFAVPAFGLPALSIPFAIGTALIVGYLARDTGVQRKEQSFGAAAVSGFLAPVFALLIGWIVTWFV